MELILTHLARMVALLIEYIFLHSDALKDIIRNYVM